MKTASASHTGASPAVIRAARRWMLSGLVLSVLGTRVVDGGINATVALGALPAVWIAAYATAETAVSALSPAFARRLQHRSPAKTLITCDLIETIAAATAVPASLLLTARAFTVVLVAYLAVASVLPAVADLAEEFYAHHLAQLGPGHALAFNAHAYSLLTLTGLLLAMPLGALMATTSIATVLAINAVLTGLGLALRTRSTYLLPTPSDPSRDPDQATQPPAPRGVRRRGRLADLIRLGPTSPPVALLSEYARGLTGVYLLLWATHSLSIANPAHSLAVLFVLSALGATIGPQAARLLGKRQPPAPLLYRSTLLSIAALLTLAALAGLVPHSPATFIAVILYTPIAPALNRYRHVLTDTLRQTTLDGQQFTTAMSWTLSLESLGNLAGVWTAAALSVNHTPTSGLLLAATSYLLTLPALKNNHQSRSCAKAANGEACC